MGIVLVCRRDRDPDGYDIEPSGSCQGIDSYESDIEMSISLPEDVDSF